MNLNKFYELQKELDKTILENERGRTGKEIDKDLLLNQTILALQVEVAELANATRCFKHWSTKGPNNKVAIPCDLCDGTGDENYHMIMEAAGSNMKHEYIECEECGGTGIIGYKNPILEEYADVLHFYLSLGNQLGFSKARITDYYTLEELKDDGYNDMTKELIRLLITGGTLQFDRKWYCVWGYRLKVLSEMLGFTNEEVEQAYLEKHKENYKRQEEGY